MRHLRQQNDVQQPRQRRKTRYAEYLCYMGANHRIECSGQRAYVAKRVERLVIQVTGLLLDSIRDTPKDASIEKRMKEEIKALSDRVKDAKKKADNAAQEQKNLEQEVAKSLMGKSRFNPEMLSRLIEEASQKKKELQRTAIELEQQLANQKKIAEELSSYYDRFLGWSGEFGMASIERKRMIIAYCTSGDDILRQVDFIKPLNIVHSRMDTGGEIRVYVDEIARGMLRRSILVYCTF